MSIVYGKHTILIIEWSIISIILQLILKAVHFTCFDFPFNPVTTTKSVMYLTSSI